MRKYRPLTQEEKEKRKMQQELLGAQELAATLYEQNQALNTALLDTQELVAQLVENGGTV